MIRTLLLFCLALTMVCTAAAKSKDRDAAKALHKIEQREAKARRNALRAEAKARRDRERALAKERHKLQRLRRIERAWI